MNGIFTGVAARYLQLQHCPRWNARNKAPVRDAQNLKQLKTLERFHQLNDSHQRGYIKDPATVQNQLYNYVFDVFWLARSLCKQWHGNGQIPSCRDNADIDRPSRWKDSVSLAQDRHSDFTRRQLVHGCNLYDNILQYI